MTTGTLANARIWGLADIWIGALSTPIPTDLAELSDAWDPLGLINDEDGIGREFSSEDKEHFAYGVGLVRTTSAKHKASLSVTPIENTDIVYKLANPGSESSSEAGLTTRITRPANMGLGIVSVVLDKFDGEIHSRLYMPRVQFKKGSPPATLDDEIDGTPLVMDILTANLPEELGGGIFSQLEITNDPGAIAAFQLGSG